MRPAGSPNPAQCFRDRILDTSRRQHASRSCGERAANRHARLISATVGSLLPWSGPGVLAHRRGTFSSAPIYRINHDLSTFCTRIYWSFLYTSNNVGKKAVHLEAATAERRRGRVKVDAEALRRLREGYPLTVRELAERSGVSHNTITMIENRHRTANPSTVRKLAAALGIGSSELMWREAE
jgi:DNA-binding XRE family transcriptional regulator